MSNILLILTEEGVKRIIAGLAELPAKLSHELINDLDYQVGLIKKDLKSYVAFVEEHLAPHKDAIPAPIDPPPAPSVPDPSDVAAA